MMWIASKSSIRRSPIREHRGAAGHAENSAPVVVVDIRGVQIKKQIQSPSAKVLSTKAGPGRCFRRHTLALTTAGRQTSTKSQRTEYRPHSAENTRHAITTGTVAMPDVVSAGYLSQCVAVVHFGIVDLHSFTMVTNCLEVQVYDEANPFGSTERRSARRKPHTSCSGRYSWRSK